MKIHPSSSYSAVKPSFGLFLGSMIMRVRFIIITWTISLFRLLYPLISSPSPILTAFNRKLETKTHASERFYSLIIFPIDGSYLIRVFTPSSTLFFHDHAFVFVFYHGSMIISIPWSYFHRNITWTALFGSDTWSRLLLAFMLKDCFLFFV